MKNAIFVSPNVFVTSKESQKAMALCEIVSR